ncbi:uncharacterized protein LOC132314235 [Cornus florida]|uniref:uncharacterized protein LOC132314235 n=1 Tax=Cornus florida TaxID=4283 RepID=UPI002899B464|nr:uncharacterized protein LOC132314235 [Cornus florida]
MRTARSRQKSYTDHRTRTLEFQVGDQVLLKVFPMNGVMRFGKKGNLSPRFIGPFMIMNRVGAVVYRLALLDHLHHVHNVFHVSMWRKFLRDEDRYQHMDVGDIELQPDATYVKPPCRIIDRKDHVLRHKVISLLSTIDTARNVVRGLTAPIECSGMAMETHLPSSLVDIIVKSSKKSISGEGIPIDDSRICWSYEIRRDVWYDAS